MNIDKRIRRLAALLTAVAVAVCWLAVHQAEQNLGDASILSGWILSLCTGVLVFFSLRKRTYARKLGRVAWWLLVHRHVGWLALAVFIIHVGWPIYGWFEAALAFCFAFVSLTGILLSVLSRRTPRQLSAIGYDYRLDEIPSLRLDVASAAHQIALESASYDEGATLSEFYQRSLLPFFHYPRKVPFMMFASGWRRRQLLAELNQLDRYVGQRGAQARAKLAELIEQKDRLDYHEALQKRLRTVYTLHMALTWALVMMIAVHVVLALRFQGGM